MNDFENVDNRKLKHDLLNCPHLSKCVFNQLDLKFSVA